MSGAVGSFTDDSTPSTEAPRLSGKALYKIQVQRLIDIRVVFGKKKRSGESMALNTRLCFSGSHVQAAVNTSPRHTPKSA